MSVTHPELNDANRKLQEWAAACSQCLGQTYDICRPFHEPECAALHPDVRFVAAQLAISCHLTSESSFLLIANRKIWDADILLRSVLEGTFKYVFLLHGADEDRLKNVDEYWELLPKYAAISRQKRATDLLKATKDAEAPAWRPIRDLLLPDEELKKIIESVNKKDRQALQQRWSFSEIAKFFATHKNAKYQAAGILAYSYGMQCHLVHQDGDGIGMIWDRCRRNDDRRISVELAHAGRVICDLCHFGFLRALELFSACKQDLSPVFDLVESYSQTFESVAAAEKRWHDIEYKQ